MQKEKPDSDKAAAGMALAAHTPMMAQYPRYLVFMGLLALFF